MWDSKVVVFRHLIYEVIFKINGYFEYNCCIKNHN